LPACERGRFICYVFTCAIIIICILVEKKGGGGKPTPTAPSGCCLNQAPCGRRLCGARRPRLRDTKLGRVPRWWR
jgi:hypothetical protein